MRPRGDERLYTALVTAILGLAVVVYLSSIPRNPVGGALAAPASAQPATSVPAVRAAGPAPPPASAADVALTVTLWPHGPGQPMARWLVQCPPMSRACRTALARRARLDAELSGPCPRRPTGPAEAVVVGRVGGRHVVAWLDQRDGCGSARWQALRPLIGVRPPPHVGGQTARN